MVDLTDLEVKLKNYQKKKGIEYLNKVSGNIEKDAKINSPVDTGALKESISTWVISDFKRRIGSEMYYAWYQEMGTRRNEPRAYLRSALWKNVK